KAKENNISPVMVDRLLLTTERIKDIASSIDSIVTLPSPINLVEEEIVRPNGLIIQKVRVPFGVICAIFESRPNVVVDIASLCIKSGNACVLKGGKEAFETNKELVRIIKESIAPFVCSDIVLLIESTSRETTKELITKKEYIDLLIPRGSKGLISFVCENASIPFIETGAGNCHLYIDKDASLEKALSIAINAKYQRPSVCNAIETILVHESVASSFLPMLYKEFSSLHIEMRGCPKTRNIIPVFEATEEDYYKEYNDYIVALKVVASLDEAIAHINHYSTEHSEAIVSENKEAFEKFFTLVDSSCLYLNASTRFTDGGEFGFGAEIGISTSKMHARGPMGLKEITTYKYKICGNGQIRK
ncbi:MAG: glutamate-5-semialdehyde dehydrogenase, partial [Bacilli bacterium]|nr:glutamate-5-semialdehyde dehydrogenase [Bacilli bacterium]